MAVQWIICDIDGCLTPEESLAWELEPFLRLAHLAREASAGTAPIAPMTFCTGRPQPYVEVLMKQFDVRAPAICENGAVFYTLHDNRAWFAEGVTEEKLLGLRALREFLETRLLPEHPQVVPQFGKEAQISIFSERHDELLALVDPIRDFVARRGGPELDINTSHYYLNVSLAGVDKGAAIAQLLRGLGVGHDDVAGIGDTEGDLPLRESVGFFACPANARPAIKAVADYVSPYPLAEGVLDILKRPEFRRA